MSGFDQAEALFSVRGQAVINALTNVASGMAKNTPQNPHNPPNNNTDTMMATG